MKIDILKKLIKETVREAIQEELKDILLEAVKSPKTVVQESHTGAPFFSQPIMATGPTISTTSTTSTVNHDLRRNLRSMIGGEFDTTITANSSHVQPSYTPPPVNTAGEGSSLPGGEVSLDQIMGIMGK
jgi:hypothetical protein